MRLRKLALAVGLVTALGAEVASALGLGELKLNSTLNQPLNAEIKLLNVKDLSQDEILISLASSEDFQRAGVDRLYFLSGLKFTVDLTNSSGPIVRVTTRKPVNEPFLNFLLQSQWPSGNLLREYTLLMDLPTFSDEGVRPIEAAATTQPSRSSVATSSATNRVATADRRSSQQSADRSINPNGRTVGANDTLWAIALEMRPDRSVSVQQTMLAIQRVNPEAFINGNINLLRKGQVLRAPTRDEVLNLSARQAISEVAQQNTAWSGRSSQAPLSATSRNSNKRDRTEEPEGRVKLGVDTQQSNAGAGAGAGSDGGRSEALENELAITLEELDKNRRENGELKSRVSDLEAQIETMQSLIEVANNDLRSLQMAQQQSAGEPLDARPAETDTNTDYQESAQNDAVVESAEPVVVKPVEKVEPIKEAAKVVRRAPEPEDSIVDLLVDNIIYVAGGLLVLIGGVWVFLRRRQEAREMEEFENSSDDDYPLEEPADISAELDTELENEPEIDAVAELEDAPEESAEAETGDVVGEVDIYIAYGKLDQAEQMLLKALQSDPDQIPVLLKLLEVYAESDNLEGFDQYYSHLLTLSDEPANQRAVELRAGFAGAAAFVAGAALLSTSDESSSDENSSDESLSDDLDALLLDDEGLSEELTFDQFDTDPSDAAESEFSGLDFSLEGEENSELSLSDDLQSLEGDSSLDLELDPGEETEFDGLELGGSDLELGDTDLELDLDLDLDLELPEEVAVADQNSSEPELDLNAELDDFELDLMTGESAEATDDFELTLDDELGDLELDLPAEGESLLGADLALDDSLEADLDLDPATQDDDFDLSLEGSESSDGNIEDEFVLDLTGDLPELESLSSELSESESITEINSVAGLSETSDTQVNEFSLELDDELDLDSQVQADDVDLAALDQEMDEFDLDLDELPALGSDEELESDDLLIDFDDAEIEALTANVDKETDAEELLDSELLESELLDLDVPDLDTPAIVSPPETEESVFDEALLNSGLDTDLDEFSAENLAADSFAGDEMDAELDFLADTDEAATKLDLARAYIDMGDSEGAKDILGEVLHEGNDTQKSEAEELMSRIK